MRVRSFDSLRIFACILVVLVHVSAQGISASAVNSGAFAFCQCCNTLAFSGVSIFVMMSGALALRSGKEASVRDVVRKRFLYFLGLYFLWKGIYLLFDLLRAGQGISGSSIKQLVLDLIGGRGFYHLWYLPMIAILSLLVPLIWQGVQKREVCLLYLIPFTVLALLLPTLFYFEFPFKYLLKDFLGQFEVSYFLGYLGYFILGHFLYQWKEEWINGRKAVLVVAGVVALVFGCIFGVLRSRADGVFFDGYSSPLSFTNLLTSSAIYILFLNHRNRSGKSEKAAKDCPPVKNQPENRPLGQVLAGLTLGIYLIHPMVIEILKDCGVFIMGDMAVLGVPLYVVIVTVLSATVVFLFKKVLSMIKG
ncbi:MAG: acyltransferase [Lachnospiraceae bacterium]|nr:acyltransferase [Lachnospiraceae bacterium]